MSYQDDWESAKKGDLSAISKFVSQAFKNGTVEIDAEMQYGVTLWLKIKPTTPLNPQSCLQIVIETLNKVRPSKITSVRVTEMSVTDKNNQVWNKFLAIKGEIFVDNTKATNQMTVGFVVLVLCGLAWMFFGYKPSPTTVATQPEQSQQSLDNSVDQAAQNILNNVTQSYGYSRFIETWGMGTQGLFLPEAAWNNLSENDKQILIQYAQQHSLRGIVVGKQLSKNNISLDYTVWGE